LGGRSGGGGGGGGGGGEPSVRLLVKGGEKVDEIKLRSGGGGGRPQPGGGGPGGKPGEKSVGTCRTDKNRVYTLPRGLRGGEPRARKVQGALSQKGNGPLTIDKQDCCSKGEPPENGGSEV